jgi:hypothetical protein
MAKLNQQSNHSRLCDRFQHRMDRAEWAAAILGGRAITLAASTPAREVQTDGHSHYREHGCSSPAHAGVRIGNELLGWREACRRAGIFGL